MARNGTLRQRLTFSLVAGLVWRAAFICVAVDFAHSWAADNADRTVPLTLDPEKGEGSVMLTRGSWSKRYKDGGIETRIFFNIHIVGGLSPVKVKVIEA